MYQIAVCDDCRADAMQLAECIKKYANLRKKKLEIQLFTNGESLVENIKNQKAVFEMIFLDIVLDGSNGIEIGLQIREHDEELPIVYLTSSRDFAVESYEVEAAGYLLKPLNEQKIYRYLDKFLQQNEEKRLAVKIRGQYRYILFSDIRYLESSGHSVLIHLPEEVVVWTGKLSELEEQLVDSRFLRCHQSYLVNMDHIHKVEDTFILKDGSNVPIRVREKRNITEKYYRYFVDKSIEEKQV